MDQIHIREAAARASTLLKQPNQIVSLPGLERQRTAADGCRTQQNKDQTSWQHGGGRRWTLFALYRDR
jgi:hypothetical protein